MFKGHVKREGSSQKHTLWANGFVICCWDFLWPQATFVKYREDQNEEGSDGLGMSEKAVERL